MNVVLLYKSASNGKKATNKAYILEMRPLAS